MKCKDCKFWGYYDTYTEQGIDLGICFRFPPTELLDEETGQHIGHLVSDKCWCGEFKDRSASEEIPCQLLDRCELSERLGGVTGSTITSWAKKGIIPSVQLPNKTRLYDYHAVLRAITRQSK